MTTPINVLGYYGKANIGDEAYKLAFPKLFPDNNFIFCDGIKGNPETIILGGGDVLSYNFFEILEKHPNAAKYALSVNLRADHINWRLCQFKKIISRNLTDIPNPNIQYHPDFTFILEPDKENGKRLIKELFAKHDCDLYDNVVAITLNSFLCSREDILARDYVAFDKICYDLANIMDNTMASFILMPFCNGFPQNDRMSNAFAYANTKYWKKHLLVFEELSVQETLDVFAAVDAAITTRLHAAIFSCIGGTPFIDITHHSKNQLFIESINKKDWSFDFWHLDYHKALGLLKDFIKVKDSYRWEVQKITDESRKLLKQIQLKF